MKSEPYDLSPEEVNRGNKLISSFGELLENERSRYLQQASELLEIGSLEIFRSDCKFRYELRDDNITFQVTVLPTTLLTRVNYPFRNLRKRQLRK